MKKLFSTLLLSLSFAAGYAQASPAAPVLGQDFEIIKAPASTATAKSPADKVKVVEFFWYGCPHCRELEPTLENWLKEEGNKVQFEGVPVAFRNDFLPHTQMFYALQALVVSKKLTPAAFKTIHQATFKAVTEEKGNLLTPESQANWLAKQGINEKEYLNAYRSFSVQSKTKQAAELAKEYAIDGVPTLIVNDKYKTGPAYTKSVEGTKQVLDFLVQQIRNKKL